MMEAGALRGGTMRHARVVDDAFTPAVTSHRQALARFAFMLCGDAVHAEDVVAEAYARVWPRWRRGRVDDLLLLPYLRRTVANEVYGRHASAVTGSWWRPPCWWRCWGCRSALIRGTPGRRGVGVRLGVRGVGRADRCGAGR